MTALAAATLLLLPQAHAFATTGTVWSRDDLPLPWKLADTPSATIAWDDIEPTFDAAFSNWEVGAPCALLSHEFGGVREGHEGGFLYDGQNTFSFRTQDQEPVSLADGVLGVTRCTPTSELAFSQGGRSYYYTDDCDIIFNDDVRWATSDAVDQGLCSDAYSLEAVATHEIGHLWGLGHSCEKEDVDAGDCEDPALRDATMFWTVDGTCSNAQTSIEDDDIQGLYSLYGPYCSFEVIEDEEHAASGGAPLEVCFQAECNAGVSDLVWDFGDGTTDDSNDPAPCHTYTEKGQYTVALTTSGTGDECGDWESTVRERAAVLVCEAPAPAEGFDGLFTYAPVEGLVYQMVNQTDTTVYGCVDAIRWDVFRGADTSGEPILSLGAWSPKIEFPEEGTYTVVLNEGGPGGVVAEKLTIDVTAGAGGCASVPAGGGLLGLLAGLGAALGRRRRA